jgi:protein-tyrosine phosphatase
LEPSSKQVAPSDDYSQIAPGLFVGGTPPRFDGQVNSSPEYTEYQGFDYVFTFHKYSSPVTGAVEIRYFFEDDWSNGLAQEQFSKIRELADQALAYWSAGANVLIRCQGGKNRSGLVAGLVLVASGLKPDEAISLLRSKRTEDMLFNRHFEALVRDGLL